MIALSVANYFLLIHSPVKYNITALARLLYSLKLDIERCNQNSETPGSATYWRKNSMMQSMWPNIFTKKNT